MTCDALVKRPGEAPALMRRPILNPRPGTIRIRVEAVGLCRTDLLVADGRIPLERPVVLGHEFSGRAVAFGPGAPPPWLKPGTLVAVDPTWALADGRDAYMGLDGDGCLATHADVPWERLHDASGLDPRVAAYLEPVACALGGAKEAADIGGRGLIVGDNRITHLTAETVATQLRTHPVAFDVMTDEQLRSSVARGLASSYDWVIETKATPAIFAAAVAILKAGGTLIAKSRHADHLSVPLRDIVLKRITLAGRTRSGFPEAMHWLRQNAPFVTGLIGRAYPLSLWEDAFAEANRSEEGKTFISPSAD